MSETEFRGATTRHKQYWNDDAHGEPTPESIWQTVYSECIAQVRSSPVPAWRPKTAYWTLLFTYFLPPQEIA